MSVEGLWYSMYNASGDAPKCKRYSRIPMSDQWSLVIDIAVAFVRGEAGYRKVRITKTQEQYWYWPSERSQTGWWLLPDRIAKRVFALTGAASAQAIRQGGGMATHEQVARVLVAWKRSGGWRRHVRSIVPRTAK